MGVAGNKTEEAGPGSQMRQSQKMSEAEPLEKGIAEGGALGQIWGPEGGQNLESEG